LPPHLLKSKILENENKVEIVPIIQGGLMASLVVIGIILMILSIVLSIILSPKVPKDVKTNSSILGGINNVLNRNAPVPLGYGRLKIGSLVISNDIIIIPRFDNTYTTDEPWVGFNDGLGQP
jgi:predicted phage tail protein